jgi:hypothetical protein
VGGAGSGGWNRFTDQQRSEREQNLRCACGRLKSTRKTVQCQRCSFRTRFPPQPPLLCQCGHPRSRGTCLCRSCFQQSRRTIYHCLGCGREFWRKRHGRDALRYCSRACAFAHWSDVQHSGIRSRAACERLPKIRLCSNCGGTPIATHQRLCEVCREVRKWERAEIYRQRSREISKQRPRHPRIQHACASCGKVFMGTPSRVCCSPQCHKRARKVLRGLNLSQIPVALRNELSTMTAEIRTAYRRIDQVRKGVMLA